MFRWLFPPSPLAQAIMDSLENHPEEWIMSVFANTPSLKREEVEVVVNGTYYGVKIKYKELASAPMHWIDHYRCTRKAIETYNKKLIELLMGDKT